MSYSIEPGRLKKLVELYRPQGNGEEVRFMLAMKGEQELYISLETNPFQGIAANSLEERMAWFGSNRQISPSPSLFSLLIAPFDYLAIKLLIVVLVLIFLANIWTDYPNHPKEYTSSFIVFASIVVTLVLIYISEAQKYLDALYLCQYKPNFSEVWVWRGNKRLRIQSLDLVVGDVVQIQAGTEMSVDGWLIEGEVVMEEYFDAKHHEVKKTLMKNAAKNLKRSSPKLNQFWKSPVVVSGSKVISGQAKMVVLCVGNFSKRGQFVNLVQQNATKKCQFKLQMDAFSNEISKVVILLLIFLLLIEIARYVAQAFLNNSWILSTQTTIVLLLQILSLVFVGIPEGMGIGLALGLGYLKLLMWYRSKIYVKSAIYCPSMSEVSWVCYDCISAENNAWHIEEWADHDFKQSQNRAEDTISKYQNQQTINISDTYIHLLQKSVAEPNQIQTTFSHESGIHQAIKNYFEAHQPSQFIGLQQGLEDINEINVADQNQIVCIRGGAERILQACSFIMLKRNGKIQKLDSGWRSLISNSIQLINKKFIRAIAIAYKVKGSQDVQVSSLDLDEGFTFLALVGLSDKQEYSEYEMLMRLKKNGIKVMMLSFYPQQQTLFKAKELGIVPEEFSVSLRGYELSEMVGGIICLNCKKVACRCENYSFPRISKIEQFSRIVKRLDALSHSETMHKYILLVGLCNLGVTSAVYGSSIYDVPAMKCSTVGLALSEEAQDEETIRAAHVHTLYELTKLSWFSLRFLHRFMLLVLVTLIVSGSLFTLSILIYKKSIFYTSQFLWINAAILPLLALFIAIDKPQYQSEADEQLNIGEKEMGLLEIGFEGVTSSIKKDRESETTKCRQPYVTGQMWKQIYIHAFIQIIIMGIILLVGQNFIPEVPDDSDLLIGDQWKYKYSTFERSTVASGLPFSFQGKGYSEEAYLKFGIQSRHLTVAFNILVIMQIFNSFSFRTFGNKSINFFSSLSISNLLIIVLTCLAHYLFMQKFGYYFRLYHNGLTLVQWVISIGISALVWLLELCIRAFPKSSWRDQKALKIWPNKSYNLGVRTAMANSKLTDFQVNEESCIRSYKRYSSIKTFKDS